MWCHLDQDFDPLIARAPVGRVSATGSLPPTSPREPPMARERMRLDDSGGKVHSVHMEHPPSMENLKVFNV